MVNKEEVKTTHKFNKELYTSYKKRKSSIFFMKFFISLGLTVVFFILSYYLNDIIDDIGYEINIIIGICIMLLPILGSVSGMFFMYYFIMAFVNSDNNYLCSNKFYMITNDNKFIIVTFSLYDGSMFNVEDVIAKTSNVAVSEAINTEKLDNLEFDLDDVSTYNEIINIHKINKQEYGFEIICDYKDYKTGLMMSNQKEYIYKFFDNYEELKSMIYHKLKEEKIDIGEDCEDGNSKVLKFVVDSCKETTISHYFYIPILVLCCYYINDYSVHDAVLVFSFIEFFVSFISIYIEVKALRYKVSEEDKTIIKEKIKKDCIVVLSILVIDGILMSIQ